MKFPFPLPPREGAALKCPHCRVAFSDYWNEVPLGEDGPSKQKAVLRTTTCPSCRRLVLILRQDEYVEGTHEGRKILHTIVVDRMVWPKAPARDPLPPEVPSPYAADYREACLVVTDSPKASAALSRRCLQQLLREVARVKPGDLDKEIQQILDAKTLPTHLAEAIDAVRTLGNFAAHPIKSQHTGEIVDVEPGEAEWLLDTLEGLFDFYFVQPAILQLKRDALNKKLTEAGKPPLK